MDTDQSVNISPDTDEPTTRTRRPDDRAPEIARAALELFVTKGFAATKLEDVAKAAGVSKGLPYLYFKNKEELFKAVIVEGIGEPLVRANELVDSLRRARPRNCCASWSPSSASSPRARWAASSS